MHIPYVDGLHGSVDPFADSDEEDDYSLADLPALAGPSDKPAPLTADPAVWLASTYMTQTELALRLARHLITSRLASGDVQVSLTAYELTRRGKPHFPVERFLVE